MDAAHVAFMQRALDLARRATGRTSPNPLVGAVVADEDDHRVLAARLVSSDSRPLDRILIRDLILPCSIGVHDHEHLAPQRVCINVELEVETDPAAVDDTLANVVSYEDILGGIKALTTAGHINLVETLAERIAALCLGAEPAVRVRIRIEKLDVELNAAGVGIEIERRR